MVSSMALKHRKLFPFFTETNQTHCPDFCDPTCPYGCYPYPNFYFMPPPQPPPPPPPPPLSADQILQVSPYVIVIVSMLAIFCLLVSYYLIIVKYCSGWNRFRPPPTQSDGQDEEFLEENRGPPIDHHIWYISTVGLQPSIINSITVFKYKKGDRLIEGTECSVCLSEFQEGETLRLLPKCNHAFHIPCIDTWLRSHTNCPLCRAGIVSNTASTPSASNGHISFNMTQEEHTQMENLESDGELAINWASDCEVCENRAELPHVHDERKEINDSTDGDNSNENGVVEDNDMIMEDEIQSMRQSASMDSSSAETLSLAVANFSMVESEGNLIDHREGAQKSHLGIVQKQDFTNLRMNRVVGSSSIARTLHKSPVSMKRSFSCGGRLFLSRQSRNSSSILPL